MIIAFTGHRPDKLGGYNNEYNFYNPFINHLIELFNNEQFVDPIIISGMALGIDTWAAEFALYNEIPLFCYVPFKNQENNWPKESQEHYRKYYKKHIK